MPKSSLSQINWSDGLVKAGRDFDMGSAFDVLGTQTELYGRITQIGGEPQSTYRYQQFVDNYDTSDLNNLDLKTNGNWVLNQSLKLVKLRLGLSGGAPYLDDNSRFCIGQDPNSLQINAQPMRGFICPNTLNALIVGYIKTARDDTSLMGGLSVCNKTGQEWLAKYFSSDGFEEGGDEFVKLVKANALNAEIIFEKDSTTSTRFVFKVIVGENYLITDQFKASITAINCADSQLNKCGFNLCADDGTAIYGSKYKYFDTFKYNNKNGVIGGINIDSFYKKANEQEAGINQRYKFNEVNAFIRFFVLPENRDVANQAIGRNIPDELTRTNGTRLVSVNVSDIAESGSFSNMKREELRSIYTNKSITPSGSPATQSVENYIRSNQSKKDNLSTSDLEWITIPYPCYVGGCNEGGKVQVVRRNLGGMSLTSPYQGIKEFAMPGGKGSSQALRSGSFTQEQIQKFCQDYRANGRCKLLVNKICAASMQSFFNDLASFYGDDIILAIPSLCVITCSYSSRDGDGNSRHRFGCAFDFDYQYEPWTSSPNSIMWNEYQRTDGFMKPVVQLIKHYNMRWGGLEKWDGRYDLMHMDWR